MKMKMKPISKRVMKDLHIAFDALNFPAEKKLSISLIAQQVAQKSSVQIRQLVTDEIAKLGIGNAFDIRLGVLLHLSAADWAAGHDAVIQILDAMGPPPSMDGDAPVQPKGGL
jgi:hypothetical protein